jgi:hypothetical protein
MKKLEKILSKAIKAKKNKDYEKCFYFLSILAINTKEEIKQLIIDKY